MLIDFFWIIAGYFIGAIPFGYLISKYSRGIDIRLVGRKQIGATNVFHNVGAWQGILTGALDISKGWLVVFLAQQLSLSEWIQIFAGLAAIVGHNWPIYLKFFGGRGVATLLGVTLALNAAVFPYTVTVLLILMFLWDGAPATLIFLFIYLLSNYYTGQSVQYVFAILAFPIILLKRMDGVEQDFTESKSKTSAILSRLLFDRAGGPRQFPRWRKIK
jgi:acyl phosphate:glycerol-3-phosphate acyltransferase